MVLGQVSQWAAEASECAAEQDAFWEYHDYLFENQTGGNQGSYNKENFKQLAMDLGLNATLFNECLDSGKYAQLVQSDTSTGQQFGVRSTPSFLVNGQPIVGAQPFEVFEQVIENLLAAD